MRCKDELIEDWKKRSNLDDRLVNYLHRYPEVGQPIFRYLNEPKNMLAAANHHDASSPWVGYRLQRLQEDLSVAELGELGEKKLRKKLDELEKLASEATPWEEEL